MLRCGIFLSVCALVMLLGGCAKRQGPARIVYVSAPAPPSLAAPPQSNPEVLVVEEPPPPEPQEENPPSQTTEPQPARPARRPARTDTSPEPVEVPAPAETPEAPPAEVPALAPRESTAQEAELRQEIERLHREVRQRKARLNIARFSSTQRKTLEDANTFFAQSTRALAKGDLQRSLNLAQKAYLLVSALQ